MTGTTLNRRARRALAIAVLCLPVLAVMPAGCKLFRRTPMQSTVNTRDPRVAGQLLDGFYGIESGAWRWTAKDFSVKLKTPVEAATKGATLRFILTVPQVVIDKSGPVTLSAKVGGTELAPETYSSAGENLSYQREVPSNALGGSETVVNFHLDKSFVPGGQDLRELGLVATTIALESK